MKRLICLPFLLLCACAFTPQTAQAAERTVSWTYPTNTGGSAITTTKIEIGTCTGTISAPLFGVIEKTLDVPAPGLSIKHIFTERSASYCIRGRVRNATTWSANSNILRYVEQFAAPGVITISITATVP